MLVKVSVGWGNDTLKKSKTVAPRPLSNSVYQKTGIVKRKQSAIGLSSDTAGFVPHFLFVVDI